MGPFRLRLSVQIEFTALKNSAPFFSCLHFFKAFNLSATKCILKYLYFHTLSLS